MAHAPTHIISHWNKLIEGLQASPLDFYSAVERAVESRQVPGAKRSRVDWHEAGPFSPKREYLRVRRGEYVFDICGAPFGNGFFVSWWLGEFQGCLGILVQMPYVGWFVRIFFRPVTYYQIDTALMFQSGIHAAVLEVIDEMTSAKGLRALSELDRKPVLREFFQR